jgi:hypothetical protein
MPVSDVLIQPAALTDAPVILDLQRLAYQSEAALNDDYTILSLTQTLPELEANFQRQVYLKAVHDGTIVGAVRDYAQRARATSGGSSYTLAARIAASARNCYAPSKRASTPCNVTNSLPANAVRATCTYIRSWAIISFGSSN